MEEELIPSRGELTHPKEGLIPLMVDLINFLYSTINTCIGLEGGEVES